MTEQENHQETAARQALQARLSQAEPLLAYTRANLVVAGLTSQVYDVGLTSEELLLLPLKDGQPEGPVFRLKRASVNSIQGKGRASYRILIRMAGETVAFASSGFWARRAKVLVEQAQHPLTHAAFEGDPNTQAQYHLQLAQAFRAFGLLAPAQRYLQEALQCNPLLSTQADVARLQARLAETRLALRTGAAFTFGNWGLTALIFLLLMGLGATQMALQLCNPIPLIIDLAIAISLWRGLAQWKNWAIVRAALGLLLYGLIALGQRDWLSLVIQASYCSAFLVLLPGEHKRWRTLLAAGLFAVGFLGIELVLLVSPLVSGFFSG